MPLQLHRMIAVSFLLAVLAGQVLASVSHADVNRLTKEDLKSMLEDGNPVIIDVRPKAQFDSSKDKLPGAVNENPFEARDWGGKYSKEEPTVLYCA